MEVTFEESRRHWGLETQRPWSDLAIARTTPAWLGLFSLSCLRASGLTAGTVLRPRSTAWYLKAEAIFSDVWASVRRVIWASKYFSISGAPGDPVLFPRRDWEAVLDQLAAAA